MHRHLYSRQTDRNAARRRRHCSTVIILLVRPTGYSSCIPSHVRLRQRNGRETAWHGTSQDQSVLLFPHTCNLQRPFFALLRENYVYTNEQRDCR